MAWWSAMVRPRPWPPAMTRSMTAQLNDRQLASPGHLVLYGALDHNLRAESTELGQTLRIGHSVEHDGVELDQPRAGGYSAVHGVPPLRLFENFRFGDHAVFNVPSRSGTAPERSSVPDEDRNRVADQ